MAPALPTQHLIATDQPIGKLTYGIGWNWFDHLGSGGCYARSPLYPLDVPVCPGLDDKAGWAALFGALDDLRPGIIRFGLPPDPHVGTRRGEIRTDTVNLARPDRLNRWAVRNGCTVLIDLGLCGVAFWTLLNPNTIDGWWRVVAVQQGQLVKSPHLHPIYRLLSRYARPGCNVYPMRSAAREWPYQYVWATALHTPQQQVVLLALNDHTCDIRIFHRLSDRW